MTWCGRAVPPTMLSAVLVLRRWAGALVDLVLPRACAGCGRGGGAALCGACLPGGPVVPGSAGAIAAARYEGALRSALLRYKERGRRDLAGSLAPLLAHAVTAVLVQHRLAAEAVLLVPVPSSRAAAAARGGDHLGRLARRAGREVGAPVRRPLRLVRRVRDSAGLAAAERADERYASMAARAPRPDEVGRVVVVVDDIVTTGATLHEAARALRAAGWSVLGAATVATTVSTCTTRPVTIGRAQVAGLA